MAKKKRARKKGTGKKRTRKKSTRKKSTGRRRTVKRRKQTGTSNRRADRRLVALPPGVRVSKGGRMYVEVRANRSDRSKKNRL